VFLEASGVAEKLRQGSSASVLEVGFGTGLNFFLTADLALKSGVRLYYQALEQDLLATEWIRQLEHQAFLENPHLLETYLAYRDSLPKDLSGKLEWMYKTVRLELLLGEAAEQNLQAASFDAVYQDAFSPAANPELWSERFFGKLHSALKPTGLLTTYSVKGEVRRRLQGLGFSVEKCPGPPGGKREMLRAIKVA
jgi:tRNA U34 5-methylaminomethyl-2-thiouridine-forming methyltransferase MnmC